MPTATVLLFTSLLASLGCAMPANSNSSFAGFTVPDGHPDGLYHVTLANGTDQIHRKLADLRHAPVMWKNQSIAAWTSSYVQNGRQKRDAATCSKSGAIPDLSDVAKGVYNLGAACDAGGEGFIAAKSAVYSKVGGSVVFSCNYAKHDAQHCLAAEVEDDINSIQAGCSGKAGYLLHSDWAKSYGFDDSSNGWCGF